MRETVLQQNCCHPKSAERVDIETERNDEGRVIAAKYTYTCVICRRVIK